MKRPLSPILRKLRVAIFLAVTFCPAFETLVPAFAQSTAAISGRVINLNTGTGISDATVSANGPSQQVGTTDFEGYYAISGLAPGPYAVIVSALGYAGESASLFICPTGVAPLDFNLNMLSIRGRVYDTSTPNIGIAEANITVGDHFVLTNSSGHYEWLDLSDGTYTVTASAPGYASQSESVTASTGITVDVDFGLSSVSPGIVSGTVEEDSTTRQGLNQATVRISRGSFEKLTKTAPDGQYSLENVPAWPSWMVEAYKVGYVAESTMVAVQSEVTTTLDWELVPLGTINGVVEDQVTNMPIAGAVVKTGDSQFLNSTDSNGYYTMYVLAGMYTVKASAPGYAISNQSNVKVSKGETKTVNFLLQPVPLGKIIGLVTDNKTGYGISGAIVTAGCYTNTTDADGNYVLSNVPAWIYTVNVSASGFVGSGTQRSVPSGGWVRADFSLSPYTRVHLEPYLDFGDPGQTFSVDVDISDSRFVYGWEVYLWWNPALLDVGSVVEGDFLKGPFVNRTTQLSIETYLNEGVLHVRGWSTLPTPDGGVSGSGTLVTITYDIKEKGVCGIYLTNAMLFDPNGFPIFPSAIEDAFFRTLQGDVNNDGIVNVLDLSAIRESFSSKPDEFTWNKNADVNRDQTVSVFDLYWVGKDYLESV